MGTESDARSVVGAPRPAEGTIRRATADDVARAAGVSRATVSYVMNDKPASRIPAPTVERVRAAAASLGYTPSVAARALKLGRSDVVLGLLPDWPIGYTQGAILQVLASDLDAAGLTFVAHPGTRSREGWSPRQWRGVTPAAVIPFHRLRPSEVAKLTGEGVVIEPYFPELEDNDGEAHPGPFTLSGRAQVEHLVGAGHRQLGVAYIDDPRLRSIAEARLAGVRDGCRTHGLPAPVIVRLPLDLGAAVAAVRAWRASDPPVTAVCAYNDDLAIAILSALATLGLRAPDDLAVIGVEDIPAAAYAHPPLTTVASDLQHARLVASRLVARLRGGGVPASAASSEPRLVVRESA